MVTHARPPNVPHRPGALRVGALVRRASSFTCGPLALMLCAACGASGNGPFGESRGEVYSDCGSMWGTDETLTIYTWWQTDLAGKDCETAGGEACAARVLAESYHDCAGGNVEFVTKPSKNQTLMELETNFGNPDGGIVNGRADVCRLVGEDPNTPRLANLGTAERPALSFLNERTPEPLRNLVTCNGYQYGALLGLHRVNQLFYNTAITNSSEVSSALTARGINLSTAPTLSLDDLTHMFEALRDLGYERPLLLADDPTTWSRFLVENLMVAIAEAAAAQSPNPVDAYTAFWSELSKDTHSPGNYINMVPFDAALQRFETLSGYIQYVVPAPGETILQRLNAEPSAVFTVTGDWEKPHMPDTLAVRPFPGTDNAYVYTADVAVVMPTPEPVSEQHPMAGWIKAVTSSQAQTTYHQYKHSLNFLSFEDGHSQSKDNAELFTVDGQALSGYQGLPAYVPHQTFARLGSTIQTYMTCLVTHPNQSASGAGDCSASRAEVRQYVFDQYCAVISGVEGDCAQGPPPWVAAQ